jgi:hypothetical protein
MEITIVLCCGVFWTKNKNAGKIPASATKFLWIIKSCSRIDKIKHEDKYLLSLYYLFYLLIAGGECLSHLVVHNDTRARVHTHARTRTHTHTHTQSVCTARYHLWQYPTLSRDKYSFLRRDSNPQSPASVWSQTHALDHVDRYISLG